MGDQPLAAAGVQVEFAVGEAGAVRQHEPWRVGAMRLDDFSLGAVHSYRKQADAIVVSKRDLHLLSPQDLAIWSHAWVEERGRVIGTSNLTIENGRIARLAFTQGGRYAARRRLWG